jgi:HD-GYP domain-containing protein (c-di-GMP phosphodiesterase class II)
MKYISVAKAIDQDERLIPLLAHEEEPVLCVNEDASKQKKISFRALYDNNRQFWDNPTTSWNYLLPVLRIRDLLSALRENPDNYHFYTSTDSGDSQSMTSDAPDKTVGGSLETIQISMPPNFGSHYSSIQSMPKGEKLELIDEHNNSLQQLLSQEDRNVEAVSDALNKSATDVSLINKSILEKALEMSNEEAQLFSQELVDKTREMVRTSTTLIDETVLQDEMFDALVSTSNGTVVQHMTRTYVRSVSFLMFYNKKILNSSLPNRLRINFRKHYHLYYKRLLPHLHPDDVVLERVFHSGMQAISTQQIHNFATGFLLHDIGKTKDIDYHEGNEAYNRDKVVDHVRQGYLAVVNKTAYPVESGLITGYHHEYYGHPSGYGFFRSQYSKHLKQHPRQHYNYLIGFSVKPVLTFQTISFFPAKLLEIIDVFDALTDPNRVYKQPLTTEEALELMQKQFVEENLKLDPILLDLFMEYQRSA